MIKPFWLSALFLIYSTTSLFAMELTLRESEILAVDSSFELQNLQQSMSITHLSYNLGLREYLPQLSFTFNDSRQVRYDSVDTDSLQLGLTVNQPIFNGGRTIIQRKLSSIQLSIQGSGLAKKTEEIRDQVWQLYHQVMINRTKLELQNELLMLSRDQLDITEKKFELGNITEIDLFESRIEVQSLEIEINSTENLCQQLGSQFNRLLGLEPDTETKLYPEIDPAYSGLKLDENSRDYLYTLALENNLDLRSSQFEVKQSKAQYDVASRSFLPKLVLEGSVNFSGEEFPLQQPSYSAKLNIEFPFKAIPLTTSIALSSTGSTQYSRSASHSAAPLQDMGFLIDKKSASIQVSLSLQKEQMLKDELYFSIEQQLLELKQKRSSLKLNRQAMDLQKQKLSILETKNRMGEVKELDLLKGNIEYYNQEIAIWESILELVLAERSLEQILGLGLGELQYLGSVK